MCPAAVTLPCMGFELRVVCLGFLWWSLISFIEVWLLRALASLGHFLVLGKTLTRKKEECSGNVAFDSKGLWVRGGFVLLGAQMFSGRELLLWDHTSFACYTLPQGSKATQTVPRSGQVKKLQSIDYSTTMTINFTRIHYKEEQHIHMSEVAPITRY